MTEVPWWVAVLLGAVFVGFGVGLGYAVRGIEPWARNFLWSKTATWVGVGVAITVGHWLPGLGMGLLVVAVAARFVLGYLGRRLLRRVDP